MTWYLVKENALVYSSELALTQYLNKLLVTYRYPAKIPLGGITILIWAQKTLLENYYTISV